MPNIQGNRKGLKSGCFIAGAKVGMATILGIVGIIYLLGGQSSGFDSYRELMGLRPELVVTNEHLRYAPAFDAAMWSKFTVRTNDINKVFDTSRVDTSAFTRNGYQFKVAWIDDAWWDVDRHKLIGGEDEIDGNYIRVGYVENGDGTLTVYVFWFEV